MAIDTAAKRKSISAIVVTSPGVTPLVSPDSGWRFAVAYTYSGLAPAGTPVDMQYPFIGIKDVGRYLDATDVGIYVRSTDVSRNILLQG